MITNENTIKLMEEFKTNIDFHFSEILDYPFAKPYWIYISLSHRCTYNCKMCGVVKILKGYELPTALVKETFSEIAKWQRNCSVVLTGGEPFLRQDIFDIVRDAAQKKITTEIISNGACIDRELAARIIDSGAANIAVSVDGAREQTHDFIRQEGSFTKAISALEHLVKAKRLAGQGPQISVWTTIMKENIRELYDIIALVRGLGVECLVYHPVIVAQDDMQNTSPDAPFWIRGQDAREQLRSQIDKIVEFQSRHGLVAFLHDPYLWIRYFEGTLSKEEWKCNPFVFINIGPDGYVRSCGAAFGNIKEMNLSRCLRTDEANRARMLMKNCAKPCLQTCWAHPASDSLTDIIDAFLSNVEEAKVPRQEKAALVRDALAYVSTYETRIMQEKI